MRGALILLLGLTSASAAGPAQPEPPLTRPPALDFDTPVEESNPPAAVIKTVSDVPAELAAAKPWIARRYMTGAVRRQTPHETFFLRRVGNQALITHEVRVPTKWKRDRDFNNQILAWRVESSTQLLGTVEGQGKTIKISAANGSVTLELVCRKTTVAAARADAMRGRTPALANQECGDPGRWVPTATTRVSVLRCEPDADSGWDELAFAPGTGVEWVHVNDDCVIQGGGWRRVAADGAIKHPRQRDQWGPSKAPGKAPGKPAKR